MPEHKFHLTFDNLVTPPSVRNRLIGVARFNSELVLVLFLIVMLSVLFMSEVNHSELRWREIGPPTAETNLTERRFAFAGPGWRLHTSAITNSDTDAAQPQSTGSINGGDNLVQTKVASSEAPLEPHALMPGPGADPLATVLLGGLPAGASLSDGVRIGDTRWAIAVGQLDNVVVQLPPPRGESIRTSIELRDRAGVAVHEFTIELRQPVRESIAERSGRQKPLSGKGAVKPAGSKAQQGARKSKLKAATQTSGPKPALAAVSVAPVVVKTAAVPAIASPIGLLAPLPPGAMFTPDPKDTAASKLAPGGRDDPRYMTLRGLGGPPAD